MIRQSQRDLPKDNTNSLVLEVLRFDLKKGVENERRKKGLKN
jgi:hypothetical protein